MQNKKTRSVSAKKQGQCNKSKPYTNSITSQCNRILEIFKLEGSQSTFQLRHKGIVHPAGRIKNLRDQGHKIFTDFIHEVDANSVPHRIALYVYRGYIGGKHV